MRDSYTKLFEQINIDDFFKIAIEDITYIEDEKIKIQWNELKERVFNNGEIFIRGYGRNASNTHLYFKFYEKLLGNTNIKKDSSNNAEPTKLLKNLTEFSKTEMRGKTKIMNYQISHLFGRTKNPLLFGCSWNIAYLPKYIDPFTGDETQGIYSKRFKEIFRPIIKEKFKFYINDYNEIIRNFINPHIKESLAFVKKECKLDKSDFEKFERDLKNELNEI